MMRLFSKIWIFFGLAVPVVLTFSCAKQNAETQYRGADALRISPSSIRLFNFSSYDLDLIVNNVALTNLNSLPSDPSIPAIPTPYFPDGKWLSKQDGNPYFIPTSVLGKDGSAHIQVLKYGTLLLDTLIQDMPATPSDCYVLYSGKTAQVLRSTTAPAAADHFKLRIINLGSSMQDTSYAGPVTLTYADGSAIDTKLNAIAAGAPPGDYVELPYGEYRFKLFVNGNFDHPLSEAGNEYDNPPSANLQMYALSQLHTFKPGGVYSIVVGDNVFQIVNFGSPAPIVLNSYHIITEINPGVNKDFAHLQAVNALPGKSISFFVDGVSLGGPVPFSAATDYGSYIAGSHEVEVRDAQGNTLIKKTTPLLAYDNITAWTYEKNGIADLVFSSNAFSPRFFQSNFLNLCSDSGVVTFTADDQPIMGAEIMNIAYAYSWNVKAAQALAPGEVFTDQPFATFAAGFTLLNEISITLPPIFRVYNSGNASQPTIPGVLLAQVAPLKSSDFIANSNMYSGSTYGGLLPPGEPGSYTVALIGRAAAAAPPTEQARLIIVKHNK